MAKSVLGFFVASWPLSCAAIEQKGSAMLLPGPLLYQNVGCLTAASVTDKSEIPWSGLLNQV